MARGYEEDGVQFSKPVKVRIDSEPAREELKPAKGREGLKNKEIHLKLNPWQIGRVGILVVALLAVFFLGRLSANNFQLTGLTTGGTIDTAVGGNVAAEAAQPEAAEAPAEELSPKEETQAVDEPIVETYKNTKVNLEAVEVAWKETWGQITGLEFSLVNGESGSIAPGYFLVMLEGYDDVEKKATLPSELQLIKSGETKVEKVSLDKPFNYNEKNAGNLENVNVRVILFNQADPPKPMASAQKDFNLKR